MTPRPPARLALLGMIPLAAALLAGCAAPATTAAGTAAGAGRPSAAQAAACRQRADEVHDRQNRADLYHSDVYAGGTRDAMFSSTGSPAASVTQLSSRYARERLLDNCLRGAAGNVASTPDAPLPSATPAPAPPAAPPRPRR